jgi:hypothetical protein
MAEQTHGNKQVKAQVKHMEILRESEAYKLLRFAFLKGMLNADSNFNYTVARFLDTGIVESNLEPRERYLNGR